MGTIKYKGFTGEYQYLEDEKIYHGKIINISDLVTFEGKTIYDVRKAFIEAVDDYIEIIISAGFTF